MVDLIKAAVGAGVAYIFGESAVDIFRQIAEAMKEKCAQSDKPFDELDETTDEGADSE
jgi:hypothetical protein